MSFLNYFRKDNPFDCIILGFIMRLVGNVFGLFLPHQITDAVFGSICWILIFQGFSRISEKLRFQIKGSYRALVKFFLFLCLIMIIRGYTIDYNYPWWTTLAAIDFHTFYPTYLICYLMPFVALIPIKYYNFRLVTIYSVLFIVLTLVLSFYYRSEIMNKSTLAAMGFTDVDGKSANSLAYCGQFVMISLFYKFLPSKKWLYNFGGVIICLLLMIIGARRGETLTYCIFLVGALYFYTSAKQGASKYFGRFIAIIGVVVFAMLIVESSVSSFIIERGMTDSRSYVEDSMLDQMSEFDKIFGKGLNGRYYCPLRVDDKLNGWRYGIETGFYNLVLKGGYLLACTYILILLIPMYKGFFKSKNLFCKAGAFFILYHIVTQKTFGILTFNLSFFLLWMMIVSCMNKEVRNMTDQEIKERFFYNL